MRSVWRGTITVGKVTIPATLAKATEHEDVSFRSIHRACGTPVTSQRRCPSCDEAVPSMNDTIRAYEFAQGQYVGIENDELEAALGGRELELDRFITTSDVPPVAIGQAYWVLPGDDAAQLAYQALLEGLVDTGTVGMGRLSLYSKERVVIIRPVDTRRGSLLALQLVYTAAEVRDPGHAPYLTVPAEARALMVEVIEQRRRNFDLNRLRKLYPPRVKQLLDAKAAAGGERITVPEPKKAAPRDLVAALKGSVSKARRDRAAA